MQHDDDPEICTALAENQCSCGEFFQDRNSLDIHITGLAPIPHVINLAIHTHIATLCGNILELTTLKPLIIIARNMSLSVRKVGTTRSTLMNIME